MKKHFAYVIGFILFYSQISNASKETFTKDANKTLSALKHRDLEVGIVIQHIQSGEILYSKNADTLLMPASVNKVFTAYTALKKLKPTFVFKTRVFQTGISANGMLSGNLYLKGDGDPSLVSERLWMLVNDLRRAGIKKIGGDLIGDDSYFDKETTPESRPKYLTDQAYNAPIGALSFNFNTTTIYIQPAKQVGDAPGVYSDPENAYIDLVNQAKTGKEGSKNDIAVTRTKYVEGDIGDTVLLRGSLPLDAPEKRVYRNIVNPTRYTMHMLRDFLNQRGIEVTGKIDEGTVPSGAKQILEFESLPLWQIVWGMNKFSNNFVADQLLKKVGAECWGPPGTREKGLLAMEDLLKDIGVKKSSYSIVDGSGLTRKTKVTAAQVTQVLVAAFRDLAVGPEFVASLAVAGEDGTMRRRFQSLASGTVRAKTGTLDGVTALAGYASGQDDAAYAFTVLLNDPKGRYGHMAAWADEVASLITKYRR